VSIYSTATRFFRDRLADSWVPGYLAERGLRPDALERWQAGYAPAGPETLTRYLRAAGYDDPLILAAGLARRSRSGFLTDMFRDRFMLPIRSPRGTIIAFIGRRADHAGNAGPRYLNSPGTSCYDKSEILFGLWEARDALAAGALPVIAEGPLDVIAIAAAGGNRYAPVAPCGTALTARQVAALGRACDLRAAGVLAALDADEPGQRAALNAYHLLSPLAGSTRAMVMPPGYDPAQLLSDHGYATLAFALAHCRRPLADLVIDAEVAGWTRWLQFAEARVSALRAIAPVIAAMPAADVARQVSRLAARLDLEYALVTEAVMAAIT
jgi:DNA primase